MSHVWTLFLISNLDFLKCGVLAHVGHVASPKIYKYNFRLRNKKTFCQNAVIFNLKFIHIMLSPNDSSKRNYGNPHAIFQNVNVPAATMAILTFFDNVLVIRNMLEIHFSKCKCPGGYDGDPHVFWQCSGHKEHVWNPFFRMWHQLWTPNSFTKQLNL